MNTKIQHQAHHDPNGFYTERWADGYMVYHGRNYCFSYSITRAKDKLIELRVLTKGFILVEWRSNIERGSDLITRVETYINAPHLDSDEIQFTTIYPAQNDPKLFALRKRRVLMPYPEFRLKYEAMFDVDIYVSGNK